MYLIVEAPQFGRVKNHVVSNNKTIFEAVLHQSNQVNKNGRLYPLSVVAQSVQSIEPRLKEKIFGGELDHPLPTEDSYHSQLRHITLSLKEMSHVFTALWFEGDKLVGKGETLNTPNGKILSNLIQEGVHVGFSLRGFAENLRREKDYEVVEPPLVLIAIDAVATPSHPSAKINRVLNVNESELQQIEDPQVKVLLESYNRIKKNIKKVFFFKSESNERF